MLLLASRSSQSSEGDIQGHNLLIPHDALHSFWRPNWNISASQFHLLQWGISSWLKSLLELSHDFPGTWHNIQEVSPDYCHPAEKTRDSELRPALVLFSAVVILRGSCPSKSGYFLGCGQTIAVGVTESQTQSQRPGVPVCWEVRQSSARNTKNIGTFLAIQWLRIHASTAVGTGSMPAWRTKIQLAVWCGQKIKARNTKIINLSSPLCHWWLKRHNTVFSLEFTELRRCFYVFSILMFKTFSFLELLGWNFWELFTKIEILKKLQNWKR